MPVTELPGLPTRKRTYEPATDPLTAIRQAALAGQATQFGISQPGGFQGGGIAIGPGLPAFQGTSFGSPVISRIGYAQAPTQLQAPVPSLAPGPGGGFGPGDGGGGGGPPPDFRLDIPGSEFRNWFLQNVPQFAASPTLSGSAFSPEQANQLLVLNALLPFLGPEDVGEMARFIFRAAGGSQGPFAAYQGLGPIASPVRERVGEQTRLQDALAVSRLFSDPSFRSLAESGLGLGTSTLGLGAGPGLVGPGLQDIAQRSREQAIRFLSNLPGAAPTGGPGAAISPFLERLLSPTRLRPTPGTIIQSPDQGFIVAPQPSFF